MSTQKFLTILLTISMIFLAFTMNVVGSAPLWWRIGAIVGLVADFICLMIVVSY